MRPSFPRVAAAAVALIAASTLAARAQTSPRSPIQELLGEYRAVAGRLVGLDYLPYEPDAPRERDPAREARLLAPLEQVRSATNERWRAQFMLYAGQTEHALGILESAAATMTADLGPAASARLWNDIAVARLAAASTTEAPAALIASLEAASRSIALDGALLEARFNRALILESLGLNAAARDAWGVVVATEPGDGWHDEASVHLGRLESIDENDWTSRRDEILAALPELEDEGVVALVTQFPQEMQELALDGLLADWAEARYGGSAVRAEAALAAAEKVARAVVAVKGDAFVADVLARVRELDSGAGAGAGNATWVALVDGHRAYARGVDFYDRGDRRAAEAELRTARENLLSVGSPLVSYAELVLARCALVDSRYDESLAWLGRTARGVREDRYPHLTARLLWVEGFTLLETIQPVAALEPLGRASEIFARIGERANAVGVGILLGQSTDRLGEASETWRHFTAAMRMVGRGMEPRRPRQLFAVAAQTAARQSMPLAALELHAEALRLSNEMASPLAIAESYWWRGETLFQMRRFEEARADLRAATEHASRIDGEALRNRTLAGIQVLEGEVLAETSPREAVAALDRSLESFSSTGLAWFLVRAYSTRARAHAALGEIELSERDIVSGITEVERQAARVDDPSRRAAFDRAARDLYDQMVVFQMTRRSDPKRALDFSERGRHRELSSPALDGDAIVAALPRDTVVVEYHVARESIFAWTLSGRGVDGFALDTTAPQVRRLVSDYLSRLRGDGPSEALSESSRRLYQALVTPLGPALLGARRVVIVPDGVIADVPFAALEEPEGGRYFVERYPSTVAPSASIYVRLRERAAALPVAAPRSSLLVADPTFDRSLFPRLPRLPGARTAALAISALYDGARTLEGADATKESFLEHVASAEVVHFGGHAVVGAGDRDFARLLFAPASRDGRGRPGADDGVLYAHEVGALLLHQTRLVVLSACGTAARSSADEAAGDDGVGAVGSLAHAFLSRNVPNVTASLWEVDDLVTSEFFVRFHRNYLDTGSAATALRRTQLEFFRGENPSLSNVRAWAPFILMGA